MRIAVDGLAVREKNYGKKRDDCEADWDNVRDPRCT
jgi:hypothetical protein